MERNVIIEKVSDIFHEVFNDSSIVLCDDMSGKRPNLGPGLIWLR